MSFYTSWIAAARADFTRWGSEAVNYFEPNADGMRVAGLNRTLSNLVQIQLGMGELEKRGEPVPAALKGAYDRARQEVVNLLIPICQKNATITVPMELQIEAAFTAFPGCIKEVPMDTFLAQDAKVLPPEAPAPPAEGRSALGFIVATSTLIFGTIVFLTVVAAAVVVAEVLKAHDQQAAAAHDLSEVAAQAMKAYLKGTITKDQLDEILSSTHKAAKDLASNSPPSDLSNVASAVKWGAVSLLGLGAVFGTVAIVRSMRKAHAALATSEPVHA